MVDGIEELYDAMLQRTPLYHKAIEAIDAYIAGLEKGSVFTWAPVIDGKGAYLAPATEARCAKAVVKELRKCRREITEHLERLDEIAHKRQQSPHN